MQQNNNVLLTPLKNKKGWQAMLKQTDQAFSGVFNKALSTIRQPIESLLNSINALTHIQNASKVRSSKSLKLHVFGKLAAAMWVFNNL